ncbi:hypothetical protein SLS62_010859 [Diatrype stigma]|uniref:2EXR domain-containing protein n=1 Tax=Diatrype stigma TaxID=117547 RepID=A0AAN9YH72_9PEZI
MAAAAAQKQPSDSNSNSSQSDTFTPSSFPRFPHLPAELRLQIWRHALEAPRVVDAQFAHPWDDDDWTPSHQHHHHRYHYYQQQHASITSTGADGTADGGGPALFSTHCHRKSRFERAPALSFACRESRDVVSQYPRYATLAVSEVEPEGQQGRRRQRQQCRCRFVALAEDDVLAVPGEAALHVNPLMRVRRVGSGVERGCGRDDDGDGGRLHTRGKCDGGGVPGGVRRVLVQTTLDALFDVVGSGPWYPSGWPHTKAMKRAVARAAFERLRSVLGDSGGDLQTVYCLEDGWEATPQGLKNLRSFPSSSTVGSAWDCGSTFAHMVKLYDEATES